MSPFRVLGLEHTATVVEVKRAYAALLRKHRPDDDPANFQRVHEAYEACLRFAKAASAPPAESAQMDDPDAGPTHASDDPSGMPSGTHSRPVAPVLTRRGSDADDASTQAATALSDQDPPQQQQEENTQFNAAEFAQELEYHLCEHPHGMSTWLQRHPALYSLSLKHALRPLVVQVLNGVGAAANIGAVETVVAFFALDSVAQSDAWLVHQLEAGQQQRADAERFEHLLREHAGRKAKWADRQMARELTSPISRLRRLLLILVPGLAGRIGKLATDLKQLDPRSFETRLEPDSVAFWLQANDRSALGRPRLVLAAARILTWTLPVAAYLGLVNPDSSVLANWGIGVAACAGAWLVYALLMLGVIRFLRYNRSHLHWDMPITFAIATTLVGVALMPLAFGEGLGLGLCALGAWTWMSSRGSPAAKWASILTAFAAFIVAIAVESLLTHGDTPGSNLVIAIYAAYICLLLVMHDVFWAWQADTTLDNARRGRPWLYGMWGLFALHVAAVAGLASRMPAS